MKNKLAYRFLFVGLPLLVFSLLATSLALTWLNYAHLEKTVRDDYENIVRVAASDVRSFAAGAVVTVEALAALLQAVRPDEWGQLIALRAFSHVEKRFQTLALYSPQGEKLAGDEEEEHFAEIKDELLSKALSGETSISGVRFGKMQSPYVYMAVPLRHLGKISSVLFAKFSLKKLWDLLEEISVGQSGRVSILDESGRFVGHLDMERVVAGSSGANPEVVKQILDSGEPVQWREGEKGNDFFMIAVHIPELAWIVLLYQPIAEIHSHFYASMSVAAGATAAICLLAAFFYWLWFQGILNPIQRLTRQTRRIIGGNLEKGVFVKSDDEIGELGRAFNKMVDSLREKIASEKKIAAELVQKRNLSILGEAASKVNHEVGNFLNKVNMVNRSLKAENLSEPVRELVGLIGEESTHLGDFIDKFMNVARKRELFVQNTDFDIVVSEVIAFYGPLGAEKNIVVEKEGFEGLPEVCIDLQQMRGVMDNLVKNALEAVGEDGRVVVRGAFVDGWLDIRVIDDGHGIDEETAKKIFEPFFTTKGGKGNGLGLAMAKSLVEAHGGEIRCESKEGEGTTFIIWIPVG